MEFLWGKPNFFEIIPNIRESNNCHFSPAIFHVPEEKAWGVCTKELVDCYDAVRDSYCIGTKYQKSSPFPE